MTSLTDMLRANGSWEADAAAAKIARLEAALRWIVEQEKQTAHPTVCAIVETARKALETQTYGGQQDDSALKADHPIALSAEDIRKMNHE